MCHGVTCCGQAATQHLDKRGLYHTYVCASEDWSELLNFLACENVVTGNMGLLAIWKEVLNEISLAANSPQEWKIISQAMELKMVMQSVGSSLLQLLINLKAVQGKKVRTFSQMSLLLCQLLLVLVITNSSGWLSWSPNLLISRNW